MNPKVSIIIPIRNSEKTLHLCLKSVLKQTYENYEIILIDNNSNDASKKIIDKFLKENKKINYYFNSKIGRGSARNTGILKSTGDIIAMIDSDCIAPETWLSSLTWPIIFNGEIATMGSEYDLINNYWTKNIQKSNDLFIKKNINNGYIKTIDTKNFAIKSDVIKKTKFDEDLEAFEDFDLYLKISSKYKIVFLPDNNVGHCHKNSITKNAMLNFDRGYWNAKIYKKNKFSITHPMFESISIFNFIKFPFWLFWQLIKNPINFPYTFVSEISWRIGILGGLIK